MSGITIVLRDGSTLTTDAVYLDFTREDDWVLLFRADPDVQEMGRYRKSELAYITLEEDLHRVDLGVETLKEVHHHA